MCSDTISCSCVIFSTNNLLNLSKKTMLMCGYLLFLIFVCYSKDVNGAVAMNSHSHRHSVSQSRERETDGAYSPRGLSHSMDNIELDHVEGHRTDFDHEAILGSAKEAEEFDNLPPEEAKKRLGILVKKMDLDSDKYIERVELKAWIIRSFRMLSEEESKERFEEVDEDDDGRLTWKEYVDETFGLNVDEMSIPLMNDLEEQRMMSDDKALFQAADKNKDGYLDKIEHLSFTHPEEDADMLPIIYGQTIKDKDKNGDGAIDFKEYIGDRAKDKDSAWLNEEKDKFDHELDKDQDGLLNRQEIISWVVPSNEEIADDEVNHLFAASDDDHDDRLSYDEIIEHHDIFVGSEATDYGEHLHNVERFTDEL